MAKYIDKIDVTSCLRDWNGSYVKDLFTEPDKITIIGAVSDEGKLYLIYSYEENDF